MNASSFGFVIGLIVGLILVVCLFKYANKDGKIRTEYDERQKAVRGKAYKYAFYTDIFVQALLMLIFMSDYNLPVENYALVFTGVIIGCIVLAAYCIWNDVYWGLNNNHKRYHAIFVIALILNFLPVYFQAKGGSLFENGKIGMPMLNIAVIIMMVIIYAELLIKKFIDNRSGDRE